MITLSVLNDAAIRHGFFTREGGVSSGVFASLNCGFGSGDEAANVARLVTCHQIHSATIVTVERPWLPAQAPRADGMVTRIPGLALGILAADCAPVLFVDPTAQVIGAAHAGWRGALGGVLEACLAGMAALGAEPGRTRAGIGPAIAQRSYEVGADFVATFLAADPGNALFFVPARREGHSHFDLAGYIAERLARAGVAGVQRAPHDTVAEEDRFFSYRRGRLRGESDYGRLLAAIALDA
jgi:hypothetical protein